ncbi:MAG: class I SAM-dependent methyltransferase [Stellaceae bacterium]
MTAAPSRPRLRRLLRKWRSLISPAARRARAGPFPGSAQYWDRRYQGGGHSGGGSYGALAQYKADIINRFIADHDIRSVVDFGAGDGNQLALLRLPRYVGFDVSPQAIAALRRRFRHDKTKEFHLLDERAPEITADLALSLDVLYHLVEDPVFAAYLRRLFAAARRHVIIYSSNEERADTAPYVRHRRFTDFIDANLSDWRLAEMKPNPLKPESPSDFYIYERQP